MLNNIVIVCVINMMKFNKILGPLIAIFLILIVPFSSYSPILNENTNEESFELFSSLINNDIKELNGCKDCEYKHPIGYIPPNKLRNPIDIDAADAPPSLWDWRNAEYNGTEGDWTTPIRDQGICGSCYIFGPIAVMETLYNFRENDPNFDIDLSEQSLLSCGTTFFPTTSKGCKGGSFHAGLLFLMSFGTVKENDFRYEAIDNKGCNGTEYADDPYGLYCEHSPIPCSGRYGDYLIEEFNDLKDTSKEKIKTAIYEHGPVIAGIKVYESFLDYDDGIYEKKENEEFLGNHILVIVGYNENENYWICKNSWGNNWGEPNPYDTNSTGGWVRIKYGECAIELNNIHYPVSIMKLKDDDTQIKSYNSFLFLIKNLVSNNYPFNNLKLFLSKIFVI